MTSRRISAQPRGTGLPCNASLSRVQPCNTQLCPGTETVDCRWSEWGAYSECSVSCGGGESHRQRSILAEAQNGGRACAAGDSRMVTPCNIAPCAAQYCVWSQWSTWRQCSVSCGVGQIKRHRMHMNSTTPPKASQVDGLLRASAATKIHVTESSPQRRWVGLLPNSWMHAIVLTSAAFASLAWISVSGIQRAQHAPTGLLSYAPLCTDELTCESIHNDAELHGLLMN